MNLCKMFNFVRISGGFKNKFVQAPILKLTSDKLKRQASRRDNMTFKENEIYDLESYLGVDKSDHNLEDQIDSLIDQVKLFLNDQSDKNSFIKDYNDWVKERIEYEQASEQKG